LKIIEDAAEAHGARYLLRTDSGPVWRQCGGLGDLAVFCFYANKIVTCGEGGMVLTNEVHWPSATGCSYRGCLALLFKL
jgi:perosamine synthetase